MLRGRNNPILISGFLPLLYDQRRLFPQGRRGEEAARPQELNTDSCGLLREVLDTEDKLPLTLVIAEDIKPTKAHYHLNFQEIYFVMDGWLSMKFYDPVADRYWEEKILANELCIIEKNIHHVVAEASPKNRLCVIAVPGYSDEIMSDKL
ncbi:MAG: hypothetical protein AB9866_30830 [Syntrophobacteraceae bacterium]